jgi:hypothetical protein
VGLAWLSGLGTWIMQYPGIELKKYIVKKERKEQRRYNFY